MRNLPVDLGAYTLMLTDEPEMKVKDQETKELATDYTTGEALMVARVMAMPPKREDGTRAKAEEIKVTVKAAEDGMGMGTMVRLVNPTVSPYGMKGFGDSVNVGLSFKADKVVPVSAPVASRKPKAEPVPAAA